MKRFSFCFLLVAGVFSVQCAVAAPLYQFFSVTGNGIAGNAATSTFTSPNGFGVINVTHSFDAGGFNATFDNNNAAIFPSSFPTLFPGTTFPVQGHLASTNYGHHSTVTFNLLPYFGTNLVFGIWNATNQTANPPYRLTFVNGASVTGPPTTFVPYPVVNGNNQDNVGQVAGHQNLDMNLATGVISAGAVLQAGGTHTNAGFWRIPAGTKQIIVNGDLGPSLNGEPDDGVGYYFADKMIPEPTATTLSIAALLSLVGWRRRPRTLLAA